MSAPDSIPAVSVVVPCYNGGRFIDQLLASLARQTFRDFELIIVDDGSRDDTRAKLATLDKSITVILQDNAGPGAARNTGIARARAPIVLALDCDDTLDPTYLQETVSLMQSSPPDVGFIFTHERMTGLREGTAPRYFKLFDQLFINRVPSCVVFRKKAWSDVGGYDARDARGLRGLGIHHRACGRRLSGAGDPAPAFHLSRQQRGIAAAPVVANACRTVAAHPRQASRDLPASGA